MDARSNELLAELPLLNSIADESLRGLVERVWLRIWSESGFRHLREAKWWSVAQSSNEEGVLLLDHIRAVAQTALRLADTAEGLGARLDRDLLIAGALLLDVDKYVLLTPGTFEKTEVFEYTQHAFYGAHVALAEGAPFRLANIVLSHSKNTTVRPKTLEAVLLHYADYAVADIRSFCLGNSSLFAEAKPKWSRK